VNQHDAQRAETFALKILQGHMTASVDCDQIRGLGYDEGELLRLVSLYAMLPNGQRNYQMMAQGGRISISRLPKAGENQRASANTKIGFSSRPFHRPTS
jgi:hypothetical protein